MPMLEEVGDYLTPTHGTLGTDMFLGYMPDSPDAVVSLYALPGGPPEETFAPAPHHENLTLQVLVRAVTFADAETKARLIWSALHDAPFTRVRALQSPYLMERDEARRCVFACNYAIMRVL